MMRYGCHSMVDTTQTILLKRPEDAFQSQRHLNENYEAFNYEGCPDYAAVLKEYDVFESIVKAHVKNVSYLPKAAGVGLDSIYTHDPLKVTEKGAIYFPMGKTLRSGEGAATRAFLEANGVPTLGVIEAPGKMEGGDVVWLDKKTVAIGRGYRTNDEGIRQFKALTKDFIDEFIVVPMPHAGGEDACLHLMSVISLVDKDLAVVYSKFMPVMFRELLISRGIALIETPDNEYGNLGANVLALAPRKVVIMRGNPVVKQRLLEAGADVFDYPGQELSFKGTGGPTCLTCPILRI